MFCENCGKEIPNDSAFCPECGFKTRIPVVTNNPPVVYNEKNMVLALILSFILPGLGIVYAENFKKGIIIFLAGLIFSLLGIKIPICRIIGVIILIYGLYETYNEVKIANGVSNPNMVEDWKSWDNPKKIAGIIVVLFIILLFIGTVISAFAPADTSDDDISYDYYDDSVDTSDYDSSDSSDSDSYSSSSDGYDSYSHYEGDYGSSDTYGTVHDDGSVESHQTGHTDYGDYQVDSYMDSNGNLHGTVDVGGHKYYVSS